MHNSLLTCPCRSLIHSLTHSLAHPLTHSLSLTHSHTCSSPVAGEGVSNLLAHSATTLAPDFLTTLSVGYFSNKMHTGQQAKAVPAGVQAGGSTPAEAQSMETVVSELADLKRS